ncbi:Adhesin YadA precursor [Variovorax sp. PBL-H6]|nr:Adhesin YadA precursor [Variovorax sp. PBL-H6]
MNKSYRTVWNEALGAWVAASEITKARGKRSRSSAVVAAAVVLVALGGSGGAGAQAVGGGIIDASGATAISPDNKLVLGCEANATGYSVAIGCDATAERVYAPTGVGHHSVPAGNTSDDSVAIGAGAFASPGDNYGRAVAVGASATATRPHAIALGGRALAEDSISIGFSQQGDGGVRDGESENAITIGYRGDLAKSRDGILLGGWSKLGDSTGGILVGTLSFLKNSPGAIALGTEVDIASATDGVALGHSANVGAPSTVALGARSKAIGANAIAVGGGSSDVESAQAIGAKSIAMGAGARASGTQSISIGTGNIVNGNNSGAIGDPTTIDATNSYSLGNNNTIGLNGGKATDGVFVVGNNVTVQQGANGALVLGSGSVGTTTVGADVQNALVLGNGASVSADDGVAIGQGAKASGANAVAMGNTATVDSLNGMALGAGSSVTNSVQGTVIGAGASATNADNGTAVGVAASVAGVNAVALGASARALDYGVAIGGLAQATGVGSLGLGEEAVANAKAATAIGTLAQASGEGAVAIGGSTDIAQVQVTRAAGGNAIAMGNGAQALGDNSISIGTGNIVNGNNSGAIGDPNTIDANDAYALGNNNLIGTGADGSFVVGNGSVVNPGATGALVLGSGATISANVANAMALGNGTSVSANNGVAIGQQAVVNSANGVALGAGSIANSGKLGDAAFLVGGTPTGEVNIGSRRITGVAGGLVGDDAVNVQQLVAATRNVVGGVAVGASMAVSPSKFDCAAWDVAKTTPFGPLGMAIGCGAKTGSGTTNIAIGTASNASAASGDQLAIGYGAQATGTDSTAIGAGVTAAAPNSVAIGNTGDGVLDAASVSATSFGNQARVTNSPSATALGFGVTVTDSQGGTAVGNGTSTVSSANSTVLGNGARAASAIDGTAIGSASSVTASGGTAVGRNAIVSAQDGVAVGRFSAATGLNAIAVGIGARASGISAISIGTSNVVRGDKSGAIGDPTTIDATNSYSLGNNNTIGLNGGKATDGVFVVGNNVTVQQGANGALVLGSGSVGTTTVGADVDNALVLGNGASVSADNGVAIGQGAKANNANDVALGANASTAAAVGTSSTIIAGTTYNFAGAAPVGTVSVGSAGNERTITNVAAGRLSATSTDAVNGSQLFATNTAIDDITANAVQYDDAGKTTVTLNPGGAPGATTKITNLTAGDVSSTSTDAINGSQLSNVIDKGTKYFHANSIGKDSKALGTDSVAIGQDAVANNANDVALGANASTAAAVGTSSTIIAGTTYNFAGTAPVGTVSVGSVGNERTITNVAAGRLSDTSTDAVNGSQLFATNTAIDDITANAVQYDDATKTTVTLNPGGAAGATTKITNLTAGDVSSTSTDAINGSQLSNVIDKGTKYFHANSIGNDSQALGTDSVAIGQDAVANNANDVALGANASTAAAVGTASTVIAGTTYNFAGTAPVGTVSVGSAGNERTITNVAAGRLSATSTDAVNGSQLFATNTAIDDITANAVQYDDAGKTTVTLNPGGAPGATTKITNLTAGDVSSTSTDAINGSQLSNVIDKGTKYFHANSIGKDSKALGTDSVAIGQDAVANNANDVALGANASTAAAVGTSSTIIAGTTYNFAGTAPVGTVSVGSVGNERTITNVAAGRLSDTSTDAVNGSQLFATNTAIDDITANAVQYDDATKTTVTLNPGGAAGATTKITNLTAGDVSSTSTDAINGSQLFDIAGDTNNNYTDAKGRGIRYARTNERTLAKSDAFAEGVGSTAVGYEAKSSGVSAVAVGRDAQAAGDNAIAMGNGAQALGDSAISIGTRNIVNGNRSGAIGDPNTINADDAYALGNNNLIDTGANGSFVVGNGSTVNAGAAGALVLGSGAVIGANVANALALGNGASVSANNGVAIGQGASVSSASGVALGSGATATGATLGNQAYLSAVLPAGAGLVPAGEVSVGAAGAERRVTNVAAGAGDTDAVNVAQLRAASTQAGQGWNLSANSEAAPQTIAPGETADFVNGASGNIVVSRTGNKLAVDTAADVNFTSVTTGATKIDNSGVVVGSSTLGATGLAIAGGPSVTTVGIDAGSAVITNVAEGAVNALSKEAINGSQLSNVIDKGTKYFHANSIGNDSQALGTDSVAIGQDAVANNANDVALGANASTAAAVGTASTVIAGTTYNFAGTAPVGTVSVGSAGNERTITNVAAGRLSATSTDAVNGSQLFATNTAIDDITANAVQYDDATKTTVTLNPGGAAGATTKITNLTAGDVSSTSTDAINGSQLFDIAGDTNNNYTDAKGRGIRYARTNERTLAKSDAFAEGVGSTAVGYEAKSSGVSAVAVGRDAQAAGDNAIAMGNGAQALGDSAISIGTRNIVNGNRSGAIGDPNTINADDAYALGNNNLIDTGANGSFVVGNGSTVNAGAAGALVLGSGAVIGANVANALALGNGASVSANNGVAIGQGASVSSASGVALGSGATATGATLGNQAYLSAVLPAGAGLVPAGEVSVGAAGAERRVTNVAAGAGDTDAVNVAQLRAASTQAGQGWNLSANSEAAPQTIAPGETADFVNGASGNIVVSRTGNKLAVDTAADVNFTSVTTGATKIDTNGLTITGGPSVTTVGIDAGSKVITNVADGAVNPVSKEAVNGSQLNATNTNVTNLDGRVTTVEGDVTRIDGTVTNIAGDTTTNNTNAVGLGIRYARTNERTLAKSDAFAEGVGSTAVGYEAKSSGVSAVAVGRDAQAAGDNAIAMGNGAQALGDSAISIGTGNKVNGNNSGAIGDPNTINADASYALGNNNLIDTGANGSFVVGNGSTVNAGAAGALVLGSGAVIGANVANALALGNGTIVSANNGVAIGQGASVSSASGVALGSGATATGATLGNQAYLSALLAAGAGLAPAGEVSVGAAGAERRVTNVAAGSGDTDAVNVAQLRAVNNVAGQGWNLQTNGGAAQNVAPGGTVEFIDGKNIRITQDATNKITVATADDVSFTSVTTGATKIDNNGVAVGSSTLGVTGLVIAGGPSVTTTGIDAGSKVITNVSAGVNGTDAVNVSQLKSVSDGAVKYDVDVNGVIDYTSVTLNPSKAPTRIRNLAPGSDPNDAVNLSQLTTATNRWIIGNPSTYRVPEATGPNSTAVGSGAKSLGDNSVALGNNSNDGGRNNVVSVGSENGGERQVTNVAAGSKDTDAVNVSQLLPFADALGGGTKLNADGTVTGPTYNINRVENDGTLSLQTYKNVGDALGGISYSLENLTAETKNEYANTKYFRANSTAAGAAAIGAESTAMGPQSTAGGASAVAAGDRASAGGAGSVAVGQQSNSSGASSVAIGQNAQATNTGSIALGFNTVSSGLNTIAIGTGAVATNSVAVGAGAQAGGGSAAFGDNAMALNAVRGTALGNAATVTSTGGVALGAGAVASRAGMNGQREAVSNVAVSSTQGAVSVGSPGNERQITNVAGGTEDTDAVNVRQLRAVAVDGGVRYDQNADGTTNYNNVTMGNGQAPNGTRISNVAPGIAGTDAVNMNQLNATNSRIDGVARNAYAGVAAAMAVQMPGTYVPGKTVMRVGSAVFKGESAVGVSFRRTSENNGWSLTGGVGMSRAGVAATVGAEWVFN